MGICIRNDVFLVSVVSRIVSLTVTVSIFKLLLYCSVSLSVVTLNVSYYSIFINAHRHFMS